MPGGHASVAAPSGKAKRSVIILCGVGDQHPALLRPSRATHWYILRLRHCSAVAARTWGTASGARSASWKSERNIGKRAGKLLELNKRVVGAGETVVDKKALLATMHALGFSRGNSESSRETGRRSAACFRGQSEQSRRMALRGCQLEIACMPCLPA